MKRFILMCLAAFAVMFTACNDDETVSNAGWFEAAEVEHVSGTTAYVVCRTTFAEGVLADAEAGFYYTTDSSEELMKSEASTIEGQLIKGYLRDLQPATTYRVFPYVVVGGKQMNGLDFEVTTSADAAADPVLAITSAKEFKLKAAGEEFAVTYTLENPVEGAKVEAVADADWISVAAAEEGKITLRAAENKSIKRTAEVAIKYQWFEPQVIEVEQEGAPIDLPSAEEVIYRNNFDKSPAIKGAKGWPYLDQTDAWKNHEGQGAAGVEYESQSVSVRDTEYSSANYAGASGVNKLFFGKSPAVLQIKNIALGGKQKLRLTFGATYNNLNSGVREFNPDKFILTMSNGSGWSGEVAYSKIGGDDDVAPHWVRFAVDFSLPNNVQNLTLKFEAKEAVVYAIDDVVLEEGDGGSLISFDGEAPAPQPQGTTIAEVIAGGAGQSVEVEGQIVAKHERGFLIQDATGILYIYEVCDQKIGDFVKVSGVTTEYGKLIQLGKGTTIALVKEGSFTQPLPAEWTGADIDAYVQGTAPLAITYIKYKGELSMTENQKNPGQFYYNVKVNGATATGSIVNPAEGMVDAAWSGKLITVTGYTVGCSGKDGQFFNVMATRVELGEGGEVDPQPSNEPKFGTPQFTNVTEASAEISCGFEFAVDGVEPYFLIRKTDGTDEREVKANRAGDVMKGYAGGLIPGTVYEFDLRCIYNGKTYTSGIAKFTTKQKEGEGGSSVASNTKYKGWAELPNEDLSQKNSEYFYAYHLCPDIYAGNTNARNFTTCYSKSKICPVWVAAPLHVSYAGGGRHDAYKPDPDIKCQQNGKWDGYTRGHMLGSAERNRTVATNHQVFYYSNIAPQLGQSGYFNTGGGQWNTAEDWVDKQWRNSNDTCYQVVGCYWENTSKDVRGTKIPTHFYTVLLKAKKGVKKWVGDCSADELQTISIWVRHKNYSKGEVVKPNNFDAKGMFKSVAEIEKLTGHKFFTNVPNAPKASYNTKDWNF